MYFDGKKDKCMINKKNSSSKSFHRIIVGQENVTIVKEVDSKSMTHAVASESDAITIKTAIRLTLRHLIRHFHGPARGPEAFSNKLQKTLETCESLPV